MENKPAKLKVQIFVLFLAIFLSSCLFKKVNNPPPTPTPENHGSNTNSVLPTPSASRTVVPVSPTPTPENLADRIRREMDTGNIVYAAPIEMNLDDVKTVDMILGPEKSVSELESMIPDKEGKLIQNEKVQWSGYMQADLQGQDFDITPITPSKQLVSHQESTKWSWSIKPKKPGKQSLTLTLYALVDVNGSERALVIRPFAPKVIEVDVTIVQRIGLFLNAAGTHMGWILTMLISIVFPFFVWLWQRIKKKGKNTAASKKNKKVSTHKSRKT